MKINPNESFNNSALLSPALPSYSSTSSTSSSNGTNDSLIKRMKSPCSFYSISSSSTTSSSSARLRTSMMLQTAYLGSHYETVRQDENIQRFRKKIDDEQSDTCIKWINLQYSRLLYNSDGVISNEAKDSYAWLMVTDLCKDFSDGIRLIYLIEILYNCNLKKEIGSKTFGCLKLHKVKNHETCLKFLQQEVKLKCVGINPLDLVEGNKKMIISLLFLIRHDFESKLFKQDTTDSTYIKLNKLRHPKPVNDSSRFNRIMSKSQSQINGHQSKIIQSAKKAKHLSSAQYPSVSYIIDELNSRSKSTDQERSSSKMSLTKSKDSSVTNSSLFNASSSKIDQLYTAYVKSNHSINNLNKFIINDNELEQFVTNVDPQCGNLNFSKVNEIQSEFVLDLNSEHDNTQTLFYPEILELKHNYATELDHDLTDSGYSNNMNLNCDEKPSKSNSLESIESKKQDDLDTQDQDIAVIEKIDDDHFQSDDFFPQNFINFNSETIEADQVSNEDTIELAEPIYEQLNESFIVNNIESLIDKHELIIDELETHQNISVVISETTDVLIENHSIELNVQQTEEPIGYEEKLDELIIIEELSSDNFIELPDEPINQTEVLELINEIVNQCEQERENSFLDDDLTEQVLAALIETNKQLDDNNEFLPTINEADSVDCCIDEPSNAEFDDSFEDDDEENTDTVIHNSSFIDPDECDEYKFENIDFEDKIRDLDELLENQLQHELDKIFKDEQLLEILNENLINEKDNLKDIEQILSKQNNEEMSTQASYFIDNLILDYDDIKPAGFSSCLLDVIEHEKINALNSNEYVQDDLVANEVASIHQNESVLIEPFNSLLESLNNETTDIIINQEETVSLEVIIEPKEVINNNEDDGIQLEDEESSNRSRSESDSSNGSASTLSSSSSSSNKMAPKSILCNNKEEPYQSVLVNDIVEPTNKSSYASALVNGLTQTSTDKICSKKTLDNHSIDSLKNDIKKTQRVKLNMVPVEMKTKSSNGHAKQLNGTEKTNYIINKQPVSALKPSDINSEQKEHFTIPNNEVKTKTKTKSKTLESNIKSISKDLNTTKSKSKKEKVQITIVEKPISSSLKNSRINPIKKSINSNNSTTRNFIVKYLFITVFILIAAFMFSLFLNNESVFNLYDLFDLMSKIIN